VEVRLRFWIVGTLGLCCLKYPDARQWRDLKLLYTGLRPSQGFVVIFHIFSTCGLEYGKMIVATPPLGENHKFVRRWLHSCQQMSREATLRLRPKLRAAASRRGVAEHHIIMPVAKSTLDPNSWNKIVAALTSLRFQERPYFGICFPFEVILVISSGKYCRRSWRSWSSKTKPQGVPKGLIGEFLLKTDSGFKFRKKRP